MCHSCGKWHAKCGIRLLQCVEQMFLLEFSSLTQGILFFTLLFCFKQCVLGLFGLLGLNAVIILPFYYNAIIAWRCFSCCCFFKVSQAFITMLAKRGTVFVYGCIGYHFDGLLMQLLVAFVNATLSCPTPFSFGYCYVINQRGRWLWPRRGDVAECIVCPGPWPFNLFFPVILSHFWLGGSFMAPII